MAGCSRINRSDCSSIAAFSFLFSQVERPDGCGNTTTSNFHPARVFMGDAGSLTLGYLLALIAIQGEPNNAAA